MLSIKINKLINYYKELSALNKKSSDLSKYKDINSKLEEAFKRYDSIVMAYSNLSIGDNRSERLVISKPDFSNILNTLEQTIKNIENGERINKSEIDFINNDLKNFERPIKEQWEKYLSEISKNSIILIEMIEPLVSEKVKYMILIEEIKSFRNKWPVTENDIFSFRNKLLKCEETINGLDITMEIRAFLLKVLNGIATIKDVDQNILIWIEKHGFSNRLSINFNK